MTNEDIIRMAREVADKDKVDPVHNDMVTLTVDELGRLLAAEREACAKVCEDTYFGSDADYYGSEHAAAIRARGNDAT
jgi:hypothetical protein